MLSDLSVALNQIEPTVDLTKDWPYYSTYIVDLWKEKLLKLFYAIIYRCKNNTESDSTVKNRIVCILAGLLM